MESRVAHDGLLTRLFHARFVYDCGGLAGTDKRAGIFHWRLLQNSVTEIEYVPDAARTFNRLARRAAHPFFRAEEGAGVHVTLQRDA